VNIRKIKHYRADTELPAFVFKEENENLKRSNPGGNVTDRKPLCNQVQQLPLYENYCGLVNEMVQYFIQIKLVTILLYLLSLLPNPELASWVKLLGYR
jgi:hypothetical protein